jgi:hypothetical protein
MFADIARPQTIENLRVTPQVEIDVDDPIIRKGYRFSGTCFRERQPPSGVM